MANRQVLTWPDRRLRNKSVEVEKFDSDLLATVKDMYDTLNVQSGAGLAAPQINVFQRVVQVEKSCLRRMN